MNTMNRQKPLRSLLAAQFFGAFNDNAWKLFVIVLAERGLSALTGPEREAASQHQTMMAFLIFTLPLMFFSLPAGTLADRISKRTIIIILKGVETVLMATGAVILLFQPENQTLLLVILGFMGLQSALFSPAKYGILPELVPHERLSAANGAIELWTFAAIIAGTALGPVILSTSGDLPAAAGATLALLSLTGWIISRGIPRVPPARSEGGVAVTVKMAWKTARGDRTLWLAILGSAWFWGVASLLGQNILVYSELVLELTETMKGIPLALFGIGVGVGSVLAGRLSASKVEVGLIPFGAVGLGSGVLLLGLVNPGLTGTLILAMLIGLFSGFVVVPLNALLQWRSPDTCRGSVIALSNVLVFAGMLAGSLLGGLMARSGLSTQGIMISAAVITLGGTAWAMWLLPDAFLRFLLFLLTHTIYRLRVLGRVHVPETGGVLLTPNHVSYVDGLFLIATLDRPVRFLVDVDQFNRPWLKPFLKLLGAIPVSSTGGTREILRSLRSAGNYLDQGEVVCIFPEGQITRTGSMQPFRRGMERIVKGRSVPIVPVNLDRVWGSIFSFSGGKFLFKVPKRIPYRVTVSFGEPVTDAIQFHEVQRAVRALDHQAWFERKVDREPLHRTFIRLVRRRPFSMAMADETRPKVSRIKALAGAIALARALKPIWKDQKNVGILLPSSVAGSLVNLAASLSGRTSVNLNFTAGPAGMSSAAQQAGLKNVVASRTFLEKAKLDPPPGVETILLEDLAPSIGSLSRLYAFCLGMLAPLRCVEKTCGAKKRITMDDLATIIFTSGSTGEPKGVMLSHFNVDSNVEAVAQVHRPARDDRFMCVLPLFHSFGYMVNWLALCSGSAVIFHPNPVDARPIGQLVNDYAVTFLPCAPTFLKVYLRRCPPEQFGSLRVVLTGAEKLSDSLSVAFEETFGIRPIEGYGVTECAPVVASGIASYRTRGFFQPGTRRGSVGKPIPGVDVRVVDPYTFESLPPNAPGMLLVRGPNVMRGYLNREDLTRKVMHNGWYVTGDIALLDEDGFLKITDRLSRFSKIGGEMVPHGSVEEALYQALGRSDESIFAVAGIPDEKKGERLAVLHTLGEEEIPALLEKLAEAGLPNLYIPRTENFIQVEAIPLLGSGKMDLGTIKKTASSLLSEE
jgi:acyl-[acyl-carrier-protein]-phospholipid O-acyltransferase / long-chain-fatty-acid--[acyl-carrier-protein] ligase